ncbi:hypothetical protein BN946_scf184994.g49 [Trametes cinnabarina]|uniref:Uncharacterized protein n=1 Tax=Pycnoporus cinnabarinus TaxID=5643 RepID=A0A060SF46_PYCCI|nr:hypothetical protein BN946_scf184994.g49 [Trametes cinnabarina]
MDPFDKIITIPGSRRPIYIPAFLDNSSSSSSSHTPTPAFPNTSTASHSPHRNRRKPSKVFKSPSADEPAELQGITATRKRASPPYEKPPPRQPSTETARLSPPLSVTAKRPAAQCKLPVLSLYHPLGPLAQSLPELDPAVFGLPSSLSIEDADEQREVDGGRRSASRVQRGAQKPREREAVDEESQSNGVLTNGSAKPAAEAARNPSPRKRRGEGNAGGEDEAAAQEAAPQPPKRTARTRKPRTKATKRRESSGSASTSTSVSVSIAATAKTTAAAKVESETRTVVESIAIEPPAPSAAEPETEVPVPAESVTRADKLEQVETEAPPASHPEPPAEQPSATTAPPVVVAVEEEQPPPKVKELSAPPPPMRPAFPPPAASAPQKEEREEGELSDDPSH